MSRRQPGGGTLAAGWDGKAPGQKGVTAADAGGYSSSGGVGRVHSHGEGDASWGDTGGESEAPREQVRELGHLEPTEESGETREAKAGGTGHVEQKRSCC